MTAQNSHKELSLSLSLEDGTKRNFLNVFHKKQFIKAPIYTEQDDQISGEVILDIKSPSYKVKHKGISVHIIGRFEGKKKNSGFEIMNRNIKLQNEGVLSGTNRFWFYFSGFPGKTESCYGLSANVRYFVKAIVKRRFQKDLVVEQEIVVQFAQEREIVYQINGINVGNGPRGPQIFYQHDKPSYDTGDVISARILIGEDQPEIKELYVSLIKKEVLLMVAQVVGVNHLKTEEILTEVNLSRECPKNGEEKVIPFKMSLSELNVTPNYVFDTTKAHFIQTYCVRIRVVRENGEVACNEVNLNLWRKRILA